jgi:hypothetical protein
MKPMLTLCGALLAAVLGYMFEPSLRPHITAKLPSEPSAGTPIQTKQLETITLTGKVVFHDAAAGKRITLEPGTEVTLLRVEDNQAIIRVAETKSPISVDLSLTSLAAPSPVPEPEPVAEPEPEPVKEETKPEPVDVVKIMRQSIGDGEIKEFAEDQVKEWTAGEDETIDGETYQTGIVIYDQEQLFGDKALKAKALIKDGKVVRWLWPDHGMDIE